MNGQATTTGAIAASPGKKDWSRIALIGGIICLALTFLGIWLGFAKGDSRPTYGVLIMFSFYLSIGLGMLLLTMLHHLFGAGWSVIPRRQLEHGITIFPWLGLIFVPFLIISYLTGVEDQGFIWKWFMRMPSPMMFSTKRKNGGWTKRFSSFVILSILGAGC